MYLVLGATGHVGSNVANTLLARGADVTVLTHSPQKAFDWITKGAEVAIVDVLDTKTLREVFRRGDRLFLLNPPADPATETAREERKTLKAILRALDDSGISKVVGESTYGAQRGSYLGDLGVLFEMEQSLARRGYANNIIRAAYYMSNWDASFETALKDGVIYSLYPLDFRLPMVAPRDIGVLAADLITEASDSTRLVYIEGPEMYSTSDVAHAFAKHLGRPVRVEVIPPERWEYSLIARGYSQKAAQSMAAMTDVTLNRHYETIVNPERGRTTLDLYIRDLCAENLRKLHGRPQESTLSP